MVWSRRSLGHVAAILASTLVLIFSLVLIEAPAERAPLLPFLVAVSVATWIGGLRSGLLATILGVCFASFFFLPSLALLGMENLADLLNIGLFAGLGIAISFLGKASHVARGDAVEQQNRSLSAAPPQLLWTTRPDGFSGYRLWFNERWHEIPALGAPAQHHETGAPEQLAAKTTDVPCHHILVVDDSQESAETLSWVLESIGQRVASLFDGETVIEWVLLNRPDIVFLDIGMPGLNGYEVARRIRQHKDLAKTVLVALTCYDRQEDKARAFEAGFNFHLTKPTAIETLTDLLLALPTRRTEFKATMS